MTVYDLKTFKKLHFQSQHDASRALGINHSDINRVLKGEYRQTGGYYFTENESEVNKKKLQIIKANMKKHSVLAVGSKTQEPLYFESQREAGRRLGVDQASISRVLKGRQKTVCNYWFTRADSNAIDKTRAKFGDKVANKVADLMNEKELQTA